MWFASFPQADYMCALAACCFGLFCLLGELWGHRVWHWTTTWKEASLDLCVLWCAEAITRWKHDLFSRKKAKQHCFHLMIWSRQVDCPLVSTDSHTSGAGYSILNPTMSVIFEIFFMFVRKFCTKSENGFFFCCEDFFRFLFNFAN